MGSIKIGTCSWKYPTWKGLVYSAAKGINHLEEYGRRYETVEVDQWFWSLFEGSPVKLPSPEVADVYKRWRDKIAAFDTVAVRLHGGDRKEMEERTKKKWNAIALPLDDDLHAIASMVGDLADNDVNV